MAELIDSGHARIWKSNTQPEYHQNFGVNINYGQPIIFEYKDELWHGTCLGWGTYRDTRLVKTGLHADGWRRVDVPLNKVWFVRDTRDDVIDALREQIAQAAPPTPDSDQEQE